jgi:hypothetical protein
LRGVSKDGRESSRCIHPSRRLLRKLLRMRSESYTGSEELATGPREARPNDKLRKRLEGWMQRVIFRHGRACCPGHPRPSWADKTKSWMPGTSPGMTSQLAKPGFTALLLSQTLRMLSCVASCASEIFRGEARQDDTTGKSPKVCPALPQKIFRLTRRANQHYGSARLTR